MDVAFACRQDRRMGDHSDDQSNRRPTNAKKNKITARKVQYRVIAPKDNGEFVSRMEEVPNI